MKNLVLAALLGAALAGGAILGKQKLDDAALNNVKAEYTPASEQEPVCLAQKDGGAAYIIFEADAEAKAYRGVRVLLFLQMPFEASARDINERVDLKKVDCRTGQ